MTAGLDRQWRRFAVKKMAMQPGSSGLDVGTGTGDLAIAVVQESVPDVHMIGVDFTTEMLNIGRTKLQKLQLQDRVELREGNGEHLDFDDNTFDGICSAFVARNLSDLPGGLREQFRVLKTGRAYGMPGDNPSALSHSRISFSCLF